MSQNGEARTINIYSASNILEALANLTYLICEDAEYPEKVRHYASIMERTFRGDEIPCSAR
jgi:hypothetical protein